MKGIRNHLIFPALIIGGIGFVAIARSTLDEYILSIINFVGIYVILAVSLNITNGFAGLFSLGHPGFMAIGGYVTAILTFPVARKSMFLELPQWLANLQLPFIPALLIGGFCAGLQPVKNHDEPVVGIQPRLTFQQGHDRFAVQLTPVTQFPGDVFEPVAHSGDGIDVLLDLGNHAVFLESQGIDLKRHVPPVPFCPPGPPAGGFTFPACVPAWSAPATGGRRSC